MKLYPLGIVCLILTLAVTAVGEPAATSAKEPGANAVAPAPAEPSPAPCLESGYLVVTVIAILAVFGAFGGMLAAWGHVPIVDLITKGFAATYKTWPSFGIISAFGALWGAGGGLTFGVILYLDGKFRNLPKADCELYIFFACAAVAAGFSGLRLLRLVSGKLEDQVHKAGEDAADAKKLAVEGQAAIARVTKLTSALSYAGPLLDSLDLAQKNFEESERAAGRSATKLRDLTNSDAAAVTVGIEMLEEVRPSFPTLRVAGIYLGRLHKAAKAYPKAIAVLTQVLDARSEPRNKDDAALLFNRACYQNRLSWETAAGAEKQSLIAKAQADLTKSLELAPENAAEASGDDELRGLTGGPK